MNGLEPRIRVAAGAMTPGGRLVELTIPHEAPGAFINSVEAGTLLNPDEVRALIDALTPYARRRVSWKGRRHART